MKIPAFEIYKHFPILIAKECRKCGDKFRFERGWRALGPPIGGGMMTTYYICGKCISTKQVVNTWLCKNIPGPRPTTWPPPPPQKKHAPLCRNYTPLCGSYIPSRNFLPLPAPPPPRKIKEGSLKSLKETELQKQSVPGYFLDGEKMFFQIAKIPGARYEQRTLLLEVRVPEEIEDLLEKVPDGPVRIYTEGGVLKAIVFEE